MKVEAHSAKTGAKVSEMQNWQLTGKWLKTQWLFERYCRQQHCYCRQWEKRKARKEREREREIGRMIERENGHIAHTERKRNRKAMNATK